MVGVSVVLSLALSRRLMRCKFTYSAQSASSLLVSGNREYLRQGDPSVLIDIILTGLIIALVAALGYTFFISSMQADRTELLQKKNDEIMKRDFGVPADLWNALSGQTKEEQEIRRTPKNKKTEFIFIGVILVLIVIVFIIKLCL